MEYNLNYVQRVGVVFLSTDLPDSEWYPRVTATNETRLPTQHTYRAHTDALMTIRTGEVFRVSGVVEPAEMAAIDRVLRTLYGLT